MKNSSARLCAFASAQIASLVIGCNSNLPTNPLDARTDATVLDASGDASIPRNDAQMDASIADATSDAATDAATNLASSLALERDQQLLAATGISDFGAHSELSGDGNYLFVGTPDTAPNDPERPLLVYTKSESGWAIQARISGPEAYFAWHLASNAAGDALVVSASSDRIIENFGNAPTLFLLTRNGETWSTPIPIAIPETMRNVSALDMSSDGETLLVGDDDTSTRLGAAYVFRRNGASYSVESRLDFPEQAVGQAFGRTLALAGDGRTAIVGNPSNDLDQDAPPGFACVFECEQSGWSSCQLVSAPQGSRGFGSSIAIASEGNVFAVGERNGDSTARIYRREGSAWNHQPIVLDGVVGPAKSLAFRGDGAMLWMGIPNHRYQPEAGNGVVIALRVAASETTLERAFTERLAGAFGSIVHVSHSGHRVVMVDSEALGAWFEPERRDALGTLWIWSAR